MTTETQGLNVEEIRRYLLRICEEAEAMMHAFDAQQIVDWADTNFADGAAFQVDARIQKNGAHTGTASLTLMKEDILQAGGVFAALAHKDAIADYSLEMRLNDVTTHGADAATANVTWHEHVGFRAPRNNGGSEGRFSVEAIADCHHLILREDGSLTLGMSLCSVDIRLSTSE